MPITKINPEINPQSVEKLKAKGYSNTYTPIPHDKLPSTISGNLAKLYKGIFGKEMPKDGETWTVYAKDGETFSKLYGPSVFCNREDGNLTLRWGNATTAINFKDGKLLVGENGATAKFKSEKLNGWDALCLLLKSKSGVMMPVQVRVANFKEMPDPDSMQELLEAQEYDQLMTFIGSAPTPSVALVGPIISVGKVPVGEYTCTAVRKLESDRTPYLVQTTALEDFETTVGQKIDGEWKDVPVSVKKDEKFVFRPNSALTSLLDTLELPLENPVQFNVDESMREVTLEGPVVKIAECAVGEYSLLGYKEINSQYTPYLVQARLESITPGEVLDDDGNVQVIDTEEFSAPSSRKVNGEWEDITVTIRPGDKFILKPNNKLKGMLNARPIMTEEDPAELSILEIGQFKGYPSAHISAVFPGFSERAGELSLTF